LSRHGPARAGTSMFNQSTNEKTNPNRLQCSPRPRSSGGPKLNRTTRGSARSARTQMIRNVQSLSLRHKGEGMGDGDRNADPVLNPPKTSVSLNVKTTKRTQAVRVRSKICVRPGFQQHYRIFFSFDFQLLKSVREFGRKSQPGV
jgi:hypothetical protein